MASLITLVTAIAALVACAYGAAIDPQIVNGDVADPGEFPHQVSLQRKQTLFFWSWTEHFCGGTILSERWILTAGHCKLGGEVFVVAGVNSLRDKDKKAGQTVPTDLFIVHPKYAGEVKPFDIALLRTTEPLVLGPLVRAARLPSPGSVPSGDVTLSGWGYVSNGLFPGTNDLHKMTVPLIDLKPCNATITANLPSWSASTLADTNLCTGAGPRNNTSACSGDSGGPLILEPTDSEEAVTVVGVVSWGFIPCGRGGKPSVYTRVSAYIDWIADTQRDNAP
ncbi:Mite allergen Eur m 3 [Frankliniella fusca]|uniref:Mite allergen Eur m 3 n=2 Tax=Arthropoda TaxID=6656 RepID=A0AAE1HIR7_9NEOP|nr:Mite allergen Eur m 3 [Frankliniella fusca]